jgi:hypothetical protein
MAAVLIHVSTVVLVLPTPLRKQERGNAASHTHTYKHTNGRIYLYTTLSAGVVGLATRSQLRPPPPLYLQSFLSCLFASVCVCVCARELI